MNNSSKKDTLIDGVFSNTINVADRGLMYGDGVFETMAWIDGTIRHFERHYRRLKTACDQFGIPAPTQQAIFEDVTKFDLDSGTQDVPHVIKLIVTRGVGGFGYMPCDDDKLVASRILQRLPWPNSVAQEGLKCDILNTSLGSSAALAGFKHLNRIEQVLAARELAHRNLDEGLMVNQEGFVIEAVSSNLLFVFGDKIVTPKLELSGVKGIAREVLIERAKDINITIEEEYLFADTAATADEIILCNSIRGCRPVGWLGDVEFSQRDRFQQLAELWTAAV